MFIINWIKNGLKIFRQSQPFNRIATSSTRSIFSLTGLKSEFVIKHLHRFDLVESSLPNGKTLRLWSKGDDWISNQVFWRSWQGYEPETVSLFFRLAQKSKVTFDIGAYVGFFSLLAAHANAEGKVFAFEPMDSIYQRLERNVVLNNLPNIEIVLGAVGSTLGEADFFHVEELELPSSSSLSYDFMSSCDYKLATTKVKLFKLDDFVKEKNIGHIDLMKIDTESTEPEVLRGAISLLEQSHPNIICEVLPERGSEKPLEEILRPLGYQFYLLTPDGAIEHKQIKGHPEFLNYLFTTLTLQEILQI